MVQSADGKSKTTKRKALGDTSSSDQPTKKLFRLPKSGIIAGVCAGLAEYVQIDVTLLRVIFVIFTLASGGFGLLVYLVLAIVMPVSDGTVAEHPIGKDIGDNINLLATDIQENGGVERLRNFAGVGLILFGSWLIIVQFFPRWLSINWNIVWPVLLIALGMFIVARSRR